MKNSFIAFVVFLVTIQVKSQEFTNKDITGKWKVVKILKKPESPNFNDLIKSFGSATFQFYENSNFQLTTLDKTKLFTMVQDMTNKSNWKLNGNKFAISIGNDKNKYSIMKIIVVKVDGKVIFHLSETELDLEVVKE